MNSKKDGYTALRVGGLFPGEPFRKSDEQHFSCPNGQYTLIQSITNPSNLEIEKFRTSSAVIGFMPGEYLVWITHKIGSFEADTPFDYWFIPEEDRVLPPSEKMATVLAVMIDNRNNVIKALRFFTISEEMTKKLYAAIKKQRENGPEDSEKISREIKNTYRKYPSINSMVKNCAITETTGAVI